MPATAATPTCSSGNLPNGDGGDIAIVTGTCYVTTGTYKYRNINIYGGGTLEFRDQPNIDFWAQSILIEKDGALIAGRPGALIGQTGGSVTIHLWGQDQGTSGLGGAGIPCASSPTCGVPQALWSSNSAMKLNPGTCVRAKDVDGWNQNLPGNVDDCFYPYEPITYDRGGSPAGFFGYKVLAVSFGGTLQLLGTKGAIPDPQPANNSGTSWARLTTTLAGGNTESTFTIDRKVDWAPMDQVVITTTDYLPGHSEVLTIKSITTTATSSTITTMTNVQNPHYGQVYPLPTDLPSDIGPDPGTPQSLRRHAGCRGSSEPQHPDRLRRRHAAIAVPGRRSQLRCAATNSLLLLWRTHHHPPGLPGSSDSRRASSIRWDRVDASCITRSTSTWRARRRSL